MKYTGTIYRPPVEANTLLLQVTVGCTHNNCNFCTMYREVDFSIEKMEQIENDLKEAKQLYGDQKRIFLVNGDAFVLSANKLKSIAKKIIEYFPNIEVITMYASIRNIIAKTEDDLIELRNLRINDLWIGLESGDDEVLKHLNKGYSINDAYFQLKRLNKAGIRHNAILMLGAGGSGTAYQMSTAAAKLVNETKPSLVGVTSLGFFPGAKISEEVESGEFIPASELEILLEEKKLIELINLDNITFYGDHPINTVSIRGIIPQHREQMLSTIDSAIRNTDSTFLGSFTKRQNL